MCAVDFTVRQFLLPLARGLQAQGHEVSIACTPGPYFDELREMGFDMRENPVARSMNAFSHTAAIYRTWRLLRRGRYDVLHVHTPVAALVGRIAARLAGVPVRIYTAHGFYFHDQMPPAKRRFHVALEKLGAWCGNYILTVSDEDRQTAIRLGIAPAERIETIFNGVDLDHFDPGRFGPAERLEIRAGLGLPPDCPVVGIVGRLVREKGFFEFFRAAKAVLAIHPETRFLVVGDVLPSDHDGTKAELAREIRSLGITGSVVFTGMVKDTAPCLAAMDIFCLPSYREGMPISLLEAMAMQLPAIATDIRGCREEVADGKTGWLVPARDAQALAARMNWFLENPDDARRFGAAARVRVREHFDIDSVVAHQIRIYNHLTAEA